MKKISFFLPLSSDLESGANSPYNKNMSRDDSLRTSQTLLQRLRNRHDDSSWEEFVAAYRPYIHSLIIRLNVNTPDRDDLAQKILLALWQKLPEFDYDPERSRFRTWLVAVIRNQVYSYYSKSNSELRKRNGLSEEGQDSGSPEIYDLIEKEWKNYISNLAWENVRTQFSDKTGQCFLLLSEGRSPQTVADTLEIDVATVYVHKKRVLDKLYREIVRLDHELG